MIVLRMAGKILLLPVWLLLATAHLLVKIVVEIYCQSHSGFYADWNTALVQTMGAVCFTCSCRWYLAVLSVDRSVYGSYTGISTTQNWKMDYTDIKKVSART